MGCDVFDPLMKEKHNPLRTVSLTKCGMKPKDVYKQDLNAVEWANVVFWLTGDIASEGSVTEIAWAGCWNKFKLGEKKILIEISPLRFSGKKNHFANMHDGVKLFYDIDDGINYIRKKWKL
jgi:hypothetical protein